MLFRIFKIATSGFLTALECTKFVFGLQRSPRLPSWFKGDLLLRGGMGREGQRRERGGEEGGKERGRPLPPNANFWIRPWSGLPVCTFVALKVVH